MHRYYLCFEKYSSARCSESPSRRKKGAGNMERGPPSKRSTCFNISLTYVSRLSTCLCLCAVNEGGVRQASNSCPDPGEPENGKRHGNDFRYSLHPYSTHLHSSFYTCFFFIFVLFCLIVCVCVALAARCSSAVEKTTYFRVVKPSVAREWQKSLQPGVITDLSAKVRNTFQHVND